MRLPSRTLQSLLFCCSIASTTIAIAGNGPFDELKACRTKFRDSAAEAFAKFFSKTNISHNPTETQLSCAVTHLISAPAIDEEIGVDCRLAIYAQFTDEQLNNFAACTISVSDDQYLDLTAYQNFNSPDFNPPIADNGKGLVQQLAEFIDPLLALQGSLCKTAEAFVACTSKVIDNVVKAQETSQFPLWGLTDVAISPHASSLNLSTVSTVGAVHHLSVMKAPEAQLPILPPGLQPLSITTAPASTGPTTPR